ncbi:MAG: YceI family protein [Hyphomonadaceae bacterium]
MRLYAFAALTLLAACATATAQPSSPPAADAAASPVLAAIPPSSAASLNPADAPSGAYTLDSRHVSAIWRIRHLGLSLFTARFDTISGSLTWDGAHPENSTLSISIAANSVNTGVLNAQGQRAFDAEIANEVLGAEANPAITFVSRAIQITGPASGLITGDLTFNGVTRPATLEATFEGGRFITFSGKHKLAFGARTIIRRSDFEAGFDNPLKNTAVSDEVEILIQAEFDKA